MHNLAVVIGRFQPLHNEHVRLINYAKTLAKEVLVLVGSSFESRSLKNPFTFIERQDMINKVIPDLHIYPLRDYTYNNEYWRKQVINIVNDFATEDVVLVGHSKADTVEYLNMFPEYKLAEFECRNRYNATMIREEWFEDNTLTGWKPFPLQDNLPQLVKRKLRAETAEPWFSQLKREYYSCLDTKKAWLTAPYTPIFTTTDAIIINEKEEILLQKRNGDVGFGKYAMAGGYVDADKKETLLEGCLREVKEELGISKKNLTLVSGPHVFDAPNRSNRGRIITNAFVFNANSGIEIIIDRKEVLSYHWIPIKQLEECRENFFSDHLHIINKTLNLLG